METDRPERKIAVILAADVVEYSRLVGEAEDSALRTLKSYREMIEALISEHRGRVFARGGDSILAEFDSAVEAVRCAVAVQQAVRRPNRNLPEEQRMRFRIGINLGDVVVEGSDLLGDGVNVAARLEGQAEPEGVLVSAAVYDQVYSKVDVAFEDRGQLSLKNIARPVRTYQVRFEGHSPRSTPQARSRRSRRVAFASVAVILVLFVVGIVATWPLALRPLVDLAGLGGMPVNPALPEKPSIVVLPFANMSDDPDQEYFGDGIAEDLTTDLSKDPDLFVISRSSAFTYKHKAVKAEDIGRELGVRYVLEGSVRRVEGRVRITAQLIDATTGFHVWSERYDREIQDVFDVQSDITTRILLELRGEIRDAEMMRLVRRTAPDPKAYDAYLRGSSHFEKLTRQDLQEARHWLRRAVEIDPDFAAARSLLANTFVIEYTLGWNRNPERLTKGEELARGALDIDPSIPGPHIVLANIASARGDWTAALAGAERALEIAPSFDIPYLVRGLALAGQGRPFAGLQSMSDGVRLNPKSTTAPLLIGMVNYNVGRTDTAAKLWESVRQANPDLLHARLGLIALYSSESRGEDVETLVGEVVAINPDLTAEEAARMFSALNSPGIDLAEVLREAGLK